MIIFACLLLLGDIRISGMPLQIWSDLVQRCCYKWFIFHPKYAITQKRKTVITLIYAWNETTMFRVKCNQTAARLAADRFFDGYNFARLKLPWQIQWKNTMFIIRQAIFAKEKIGCASTIWFHFLVRSTDTKRRFDD